MSLLTLERTSPSPHESESEDVLSCSSYEGFVAKEHYAMSLSPRPMASLGRHGGETLRIFSHLKKVVKLLRSVDSLRLAVELENGTPRKVTKYIIIISTLGYQDTEETVVLGTEQDGSSVRLCLVLPLWRDTEIKLDGDGGFSVHTGDRHQVFKPSSVQSMWTALQTLYKATEQARKCNYYVGGLSHTWMQYYLSQLIDEPTILSEWNMTEDLESFRPDSPIYSTDIGSWNEERQAFEKVLVHRLREVMLHVDLEEVTSKQLRLKLEEETRMELKEYRGFLDQQMLRILGQMKRPSEIFDYLLLGSEWNASHLTELKELGVKYILNISREIDNFYPEEFKYHNVRLYDVPESKLLKHWDKTYVFIKEAKTSGKKVLVHCKMGISRSAATVIAYAMKEYKLGLEEALAHVKELRPCINPNEGFMNQLGDYQGILRARHNELWGVHAPSRKIPFSKRRSVSDPNIRKSLANEQAATAAAADNDFDPELARLEDGIIPISSKHLEQEFAAMNKPGSALPLAAIPQINNTPVDKSENIRNFLASLQPPPFPPTSGDESDQGIGENTYTSESGSGFSSPILTPSDEDQNFNLLVQESYSKLAREIISNGPPIEMPHSSSSSPGERLSGSTITTDTSSVPTTSTDVTVNDDDDDGGNEIDHPSSPLLQETPSSAQRGSIPSKPDPPPEPRPRDPMTSAETQPPPLFHPLTTSTSTSSQQRVQPVAAAAAAVPTCIPAGLVASPHKSVSSPLLVSLGSLSPSSSKICLSKLPKIENLEDLEEQQQQQQQQQQQADFPPTEEEEEFVNSPLSDRRASSAGEINTSVDSEASFEMLNQHRRVKSDTCEASSPVGPVKKAQIESVPKRIKEIEARNASTNHLQQPALPTTTAASTAQVMPPQDNKPVEFFISDSPKPPTEGKVIVTPSMSRSSSQESIEAETELEKLAAPQQQQQQQQQSNPVRLQGTRHGSLSPTPSPALKVLSDHNRHSSLTLHPSTAPTPTTNITNAEAVAAEGAQSLADNDIASSLMGAVKARVLDIEKRKEDVPRKSSTASSEKSEGSLKRASPSNQKRPGSGVSTSQTASAASVQSATVAPNNNNNHAVVTPSIQPFNSFNCSSSSSNQQFQSLHSSRCGSSEVVFDGSRPCSVSDQTRDEEGREGTPPTLSTAWSRWISVEDIPSKPVGDLKRRFEDSRRESKELKVRLSFPSLRGSNLRRSQSLRDVESPSKLQVVVRRHKPVVIKYRPRRGYAMSLPGPADLCVTQSKPENENPLYSDEDESEV